MRRSKVALHFLDRRIRPSITRRGGEKASRPASHRVFPTFVFFIDGVKMRATIHQKAARVMRAVRISTFVLTAGTLFASFAIAQSPDIALPPGDATRGKAIFESSKGNCQSCHRVNGVGSLFGPDLSAI